MLYSKLVEGGDCAFKVEFDDGSKFNEKDVFYIMHNLGIFGALANMGEFARNKHARKDILKRTKKMDSLYREYKKKVREYGN